MSDIDDMDQSLEGIMNRYTREEVNIWSKEVYQEMLKVWPNDTELTLYRGINFKDKASFDNFKEKLLEDSTYVQSYAAGFSEIYDVAKGFALISKSYYLSRDVMESYSDQRVLAERIAGYRGAVLKVTVPAGSVVDVQKSGKAIENEYLFAPEARIKVELLELKSFYEMTKEEGFDFNNALMHEINETLEENKTLQTKKMLMGNAFIRFVKINNPEKITEEIADIVCQADLSIQMKYKRDENYYKGNSFEVIEATDYISITRHPNRKYGAKQPDEITFSPLPIDEYKREGYLTNNNKALFKKIAKESLYMAIESHIKYRDNPDFVLKYEGLAGIVPFLNDDDKDLHKRMLSYKVKETYENLNDEIAKAFKKSGGKNIQKEVNNLTEFLTGIVQGIGKSDKAIELEDIRAGKEIKLAQERRVKKFQ